MLPGVQVRGTRVAMQDGTLEDGLMMCVSIAYYADVVSLIFPRGNLLASPSLRRPSFCQQRECSLLRLDPMGPADRTGCGDPGHHRTLGGRS